MDSDLSFGVRVINSYDGIVLTDIFLLLEPCGTPQVCWLRNMQKRPMCSSAGHGCFRSDVLPSFGGSAAGAFSSGSKEAHIEPSMSWQWQ